MKIHVRLFAMCVALLLVPASSTRAEPIVSFTSGFVDFFADDVSGFRFTVNDRDIVVTQLGFSDLLEDGLADDHEVGIFNTATESLVVGGTVPQGTATTKIGLFRYIDVAPTVLSAGATYVINAYRPTRDDGIAFNVDDLTVSTLVTYETDVAQNATGGLVFTNTPFGATNGWFGPNFQAVAVPEPTSLAMFITGVVALGGLALRRRRDRAAA